MDFHICTYIYTYVHVIVLQTHTCKYTIRRHRHRILTISLFSDKVNSSGVKLTRFPSFTEMSETAAKRIRGIRRRRRKDIPKMIRLDNGMFEQHSARIMEHSKRRDGDTGTMEIPSYLSFSS